MLKSGSNMTMVIDNLERDGWVKRERDTKVRRIIRVQLTKAGAAKLESVLPNYIAALMEEFSVLSASEQKTLAELCKKLGKGKESK